MEDKYIKCSWKTEDGVCGREFTYTVKDQEYYAKQVDQKSGRPWSEPRYCRDHREERKRQQQGPFGAALRQVRSQGDDRGRGPAIPGQESDKALLDS